jgi:hypothetical protein
MTNLTLSQIALLANAKLNAQVFQVIDDRLINTVNRFEGNDIDITIDGCEYMSALTGNTQYYGNSNGYEVVNDIVEAYNIMTK